MDFYPLMGGRWLQRQYQKRGSKRTAYSIRHKASRLKLAGLSGPYTYATEIAAEAGVGTYAIHRFLRYHGWRKHCRLLGGRLLVPELIARFYLHGDRIDTRPKGYWGTARAADYAGVSAPTLVKTIPLSLTGLSVALAFKLRFWNIGAEGKLVPRSAHWRAYMHQAPLTQTYTI